MSCRYIASSTGYEILTFTFLINKVMFYFSRIKLITESDYTEFPLRKVRCICIFLSRCNITFSVIVQSDAMTCEQRIWQTNGEYEGLKPPELHIHHTTNATLSKKFDGRYFRDLLHVDQCRISSFSPFIYDVVSRLTLKFQSQDQRRTSVIFFYHEILQ